MLGVTDVAALVDALAPRVVGGQVQKVREPRSDTCVLVVRRPGETVSLVLSCAPGVARIAEAERAGPTLPEPTTLGRWLRAAVRGRRVTGLRQLGGDRVVEVSWDGGRLVAELTGRHANLFGLAGDRIMAVARPPARGARDLRPSRAWRPPEVPPERVSAGPDGAPRFTDAREVEEVAQRRLASATEMAEETARRRVVDRARKRLQRLWKNIAADVERSEGADSWRRAGELLKPEVHRITRGMEVVEVTDWYAEGTPRIEVELDPKLDGPDNVARCFSKYRRAVAAGEHATRRLEAVEAQLARLDALAASDRLADELEQALRSEGLLRRKQAPKKRGEVPKRLPYREFRSARGERILVGRGGADNHALSFKLAGGNDHWLHARDSPGAHVVVPLPTKRTEPHPETLLDAAALAAHHSDLRGEPLVDVTHTRRKHIRAVKGAPGRVTLSEAKTLTVSDVPARLERLYTARPDA